MKIAQALGVSAEYLVTGEDNENVSNIKFSTTSRLIAQFAERLDEKKKVFVLEFIKWLLSREE